MGNTMRQRKRCSPWANFVIWFSLAFVLSFFSPETRDFDVIKVKAQTICNSPSGFAKWFGPFQVGDVPMLAADCQSLIDSGIAGGTIGQICYVGQGTIPQALALCPTNAIIIVTLNQTISSVITVGAGVTLQCYANANLTFTIAGQFNFTGSNSSIRDCKLTGPGNATTQTNGAPIKFSNTFFVVFRNIITNFGSTSFTGMIFGSTTGGSISDFEMASNQIKSNNDFGFFAGGTGSGQHLRIHDNYVGNGVYMIPGVGATFADIVINNNVLDAGSGTFTNPVGTGVAGMQILGGNSQLQDVVIANNATHLEASVLSAGSECFGVGGLLKFTITGNSCDSRGFTWPIAYELNQVNTGTFTGNSTNSGGASSQGIYVENPLALTIFGNTVNGWGTCGTCAGINIVPSVATINAQSVAISGNVLNFPALGTGQAITVNCSLAIVCSDYAIGTNVIVGDGTSPSVGIWMQRSAGTATSAAITGNSIRGPTTGIASTANFSDVCTGTNTAAASGTQMISPGVTPVSIGTAAIHCH